MYDNVSAFADGSAEQNTRVAAPATAYLKMLFI